MPFILHFSDDGQSCPYFRCDVCGELITDATRALLIWRNKHYKEGNHQPAVVCKGACDPHDYECSMQLDTALVFLLNNSGMNKGALRRAQGNAGLLASL